MNQTQSKLTSQNQVSVPAAVRRSLGLVPGSALEWVEERGRIIVRRATRHDSEVVHAALFPGGLTGANPKPLSVLKAGIRQHMLKRHARD